MTQLRSSHRTVFGFRFGLFVLSLLVLVDYALSAATGTGSVTDRGAGKSAVVASTPLPHPNPNPNPSTTASVATQRTQQDAKCLQPVEPGPCRMSLERFYYNAATDTCETFKFGGCRGNDNRFGFRKTCEDACKRTLSSTVNPPAAAGVGAGTASIHPGSHSSTATLPQAGSSTFNRNPSQSVAKPGTHSEAHGGSAQGRETHGGATQGGVIHGGATHGGATHGGAKHGAAVHGGSSHGGSSHGGATHGGTSSRPAHSHTTPRAVAATTLPARQILFT